MTLEQLRAEATVTIDGWHRWPEPHLHAALTLEEADLLHALVRATRPALVLELGSGMGVSGQFIAEALTANGGRLVTVEPLQGLRAAATIALRRYRTATVVAEAPILEPDLVFIDSGADRRAADIAFWVAAKTAALIVVHDANREYEGLGRATGAVLPTAEGLWVGHA